MNLMDKLYLNRFVPDNESHLKIKDPKICKEKCDAKYCTYICPAGVYSWDKESERIMIAYEGCVECGTCKYGCLFSNIEWRYPRGGFGVSYKFG